MTDTLGVDETAEEARSREIEVLVPSEVRARIEAEATVSARAYHAELQRLSPRVEITREPLTYEKHLPRSSFGDRALAELNDDPRARGRLRRHAEEMDVELPRFLDRIYRGSPEGLEVRVNPSRVDGQGGYFSPPLYAQELFSTAPRAKRVLAGMIPNFLLTAQVIEVKLPRIVEGTKAQGGSDVSPVPNQDFTDASVESWCETFMGQSDCSMQQLEQSPPTAALDVVVLKDLLESYDEQLEASLFTGLGKEKQQIAGILNLPTGAGNVTVVTATGTKGYEIFKELGRVAGQLGDARKCPPEVWLMRTARWAYIGTEEDEEKLPLAVPGHQAIPAPPFTFDDDRPAVAPAILGWPTYLSDAIPVTVNGNQDIILAARPTDSVLFESQKHTSVFKEVLSGTLQARFQLHGYGAALHRYPTGLAYLTGAALKVESGY